MDQEQQTESAETKQLGRNMIIIMWILILVGLGLFYDNWLDKRQNPNQNLATGTSTIGIKEVALQRNVYGHYVANGQINGQEVEFFLDTGATTVVIPEALANKLKLQKGYTHQVNTANGVVTVYTTELKSVSIGNITQNNVRADINPYMEGNEVLLGMSFLKHLEIVQKGKELTLRQY